jgi:hypothetical protein
MPPDLRLLYFIKKHYPGAVETYLSSHIVVMPACFYIGIYTTVVPRFMRGIQQLIHRQKSRLDTADKPRYDVCVDTYDASSWHPGKANSRKMPARSTPA